MEFYSIIVVEAGKLVVIVAGTEFVKKEANKSKGHEARNHQSQYATASQGALEIPP